jgi:hypothetical protein
LILIMSANPAQTVSQQPRSERTYPFAGATTFELRASWLAVTIMGRGPLNATIWHPPAACPDRHMDALRLTPSRSAANALRQRFPVDRHAGTGVFARGVRL